MSWELPGAEAVQLLHPGYPAEGLKIRAKRPGFAFSARSGIFDFSEII